MDHVTRRRRIMRFAKSRTAKRYFQWRQSPPSEDNLFRDGTLGCYAACGQYLVRLWTGRHVTMDDFGKAGGYPTLLQRVWGRGMTGDQVVKALRKFGVHYAYRHDLSTRQLLRLLRERGPIIVEHTYGYYPEWKGARYLGRIADGEPAGFARPFGRAGKNQLVGFEQGRHAALALAKYHPSGTPFRRTDVYMHDPNHGSIARPQEPDFDILTVGQFDRLYDSGAYTNVMRRRGVVVPLRVWKGTPR